MTTMTQNQLKQFAAKIVERRRRKFEEFCVEIARINSRGGVGGVGEGGRFPSDGIVRATHSRHERIRDLFRARPPLERGELVELLQLPEKTISQKRYKECLEYPFGQSPQLHCAECYLSAKRANIVAAFDAVFSTLMDAEQFDLNKLDCKYIYTGRN